MKNKKAIYVILPVVIGLWGLVGYKVFTMVSPDNDQARPVITDPIASEVITAVAPDTFLLIADYRDPFLGKRPRKTSINRKPANRPVSKPKTEPPKSLPVKMQWPEVYYSGMIKNNSKENVLAMVRIDKNEYLVSKGDSVKSLSIVELFPDSIIVSMSGETKTLKK